jgi:Rv0078B-related antitoxin
VDVSKRYPLDPVMDMFEFGVAMREQRFRRDHPLASDADIEAMMVDWMRWRPGAEFGDAEGRPVDFPPATGG